MPEIQAPIIRGDTVDRTDYRDALPVNLTAVAKPIKGAAGYLNSHAGLVQFATGEGKDRGGVYNERLESHFRVSGNSLIELGADGVTTVIGTISGSRRATTAAYSFDTQAILADGRWWLYDGSTLSEILDPELGDPIDMTWINGYYFFTDGENIYHTDATDETSIDPLKFATAEFSPDPTLAVDKTSDNQVIVFGRYSIEYFIDSATENFAFRRVESKALKAGIVGTHCETELDGVFYFLGGGKEESPSVHYISAGTYKSIATREIDKLIAQYTENQLADAVLETRIVDRDKFIMVRLPNETLLCNLTIAESQGLGSAWSIVKSGVIGGGAWDGVNGVYDGRISKWIYGSRFDETIGVLDDLTGSQYGDEVEYLCYTPFLVLEGASVNWIEIDTIPGMQLDPKKVKAFFSVTYDGLTYSKEYILTISEQFNYGTRFIVRRPCGYVRDFIGMKIRIVTGERVALSNMRIDFG